MKEKYEKFDDRFYSKLADYLSEKQYMGIHWNNDYDLLGESTGTYGWWVEDKDLGGNGFSTIKELVEDIFNNIRHLTHDY